MSIAPDRSKFFATLRQHFTRSIPHMQDIGLQVLSLDERGARVELPYRPDWLGDAQRGLIHTGILTTLVDSACGLAVMAAQPEVLSIATLDLRMDHLRPARAGAPLVCHAECFRMTRSIAFARASVWQDREDEPVAVSQSTFMRGSSRKGVA